MATKFVCKQCGINHVDIDGILCNECRDLNFRAEQALRAITHASRFGRGSSIEKPCDHDCKWNYHTQGGFDEYGNEYTIDISTCNICGEEMERERTS